MILSRDIKPLEGGPGERSQPRGIIEGERLLGSHGLLHWGGMVVRYSTVAAALFNRANRGAAALFGWASRMG